MTGKKIRVYSRATKVKTVACGVQLIMGFTLGLYLFVEGPLFYETFVRFCGPRQAMLFTTVLLAVGMALELFLEVPTGALGDAIGRKKTVVASFFFRMLFFVFLSFAPFISATTPLFSVGIAARVSFAVGYTLFSGTFVAWCVDSLEYHLAGAKTASVLSRAYTFLFFGQIAGGLLGVWLYSVHQTSIGFLVGAMACALGMVFCQAEMVDEPGFSFLQLRQGYSEALARMVQILKVGIGVFRVSKAIVWATLIFSSYLCVLNIVDYLWPVYLRAQLPRSGGTLQWMALATTIILMSAFGSHSVTVIAHRVRGSAQLCFKHMLIFGALLTVASVFLLSYLTHRNIFSDALFWLTILPIQFAYGVMAPAYDTLVNSLIPSQFSGERSTILSLGNLLRNSMVLILAIPAGSTSDMRTAVGWAIPAGALLFFTVVGAYYLSRTKNQRLQSIAEQALSPIVS
jgi:MFS family permease